MQTKSFHEAFEIERARMQLSRAACADAAGVGVREVKRWGSGDAIPNVQQFKRLIGTIPRLGPFPPNWSNMADAVVTGQMDELRRDMARHVDRDPALRARPEPQSFGAGLRRIREDNGMAVQEIADLLDVSPNAVTVWEADEFSPVQINLDKLCTLLPELRIGINIGAIKSPPSRDIPKPIGRSAEDVGLALEPVVDELAERRRREVADAFLGALVTPGNDAPKPDPIAQLSEAYGLARLAAAQARHLVDSITRSLETARLESKLRDAAEVESLAVLDLAIAEELNA